MPVKDELNRTCGFIQVEEKEKSGKFVKRFLRLDKSSGVVEWFADDPKNLPKHSKPHGTIDVNFVTKVDVAAKVKFKAKHCFVVNTPMRRYYFQANDESDMEEWVEILNNASMIVVSDDDTENCETSIHESSHSSKPTEEYSYKTEIVAGVVVQKKMETEEESKEGQTEDSRSLTNVVRNGSPLHNASKSSVKTIKQGWAIKQGHLRKNWKKRFFKLSAAGFAYFKSDQDKEPIRFIPISEVLTSKKDQSMLSQYRDNLFFVATTERIYYIQADSPEDMQNWIKSFHDALHFSGSLKLRSQADDSTALADKSNATPKAKAIRAARKLEVSLSVATTPMRNSVFLGNPNAARGYSPLTSHRLSSADEAMYKSLTPYKSLSDVNPAPTRPRRVASSSEESVGLNGSVDSITTSTAGTKVASQSPEETRGRSKVFRRTCSGTEMLPVESRPELSATTENKARRSLPLSETGCKVDPNAKIPSSASFSVSTGRESRSFGPFSSSQSARCSRSFYLDPKVDHRAAVKPSTVKKKRNPGILFSLNNMLNKKAEKMSSAEKKDMYRKKC